MADLGSLTARIGLDATPLSAGLAAARGELTAFGDSGGGALSKLSDIGRTAFLGIAAGAAVTGAASIKAASDFQASMELVRTQAGASQGEVDNMTKAILDMAGSLGTSPEQLAQGLFHIESAGFRGAAALDMLKIAAEGAKVGQADLESVTNALVAVEVSHIKGVGGVSDAMGILNAIVGVGNVRMGDLAKAMGTGILATAANFGLSMQDVGGALAVLTDNAVPADEAATRLRMTFSLMAAPSGRAVKALQEIGLTSTQLADDMRTGGLIKAIGDLKTHLENSGKTATEQAAILSHAFGGGRTSSAILTLVSQFDRLKQKIGDVGAGAGTFADSWAATKETFKFQMDQMRASAEVLGIKIGTVLIPVVLSLVKALDAAVTWLGKHTDVAIALAAAIGGPLALAMGAFIISEAIALAPMIALVGAIALFSGGVVYAYEKVKPFHDAMNALGGLLQSGFRAAVDGAQKAWDGFITGFQNPESKIQVGGIQGIFQSLGANLKVVFDGISRAWDVFLFGFNNADAKIDTSTLEGKIGAFGQFVHSVFDGLQTGFSAFSDFVTNTFVPAFSAAFQALPGILSAVVGFITGTLVPGIKAALQGIGGPLSDFVQYFQDIAPKVQEAIGHIIVVIETVMKVIGGIFAAAFVVINGAWNLWGDQIIAIVHIVFDNVKIIVQTAIRIIRDVINIALALINGDWGQAWNALKDIPAAAFDLIKVLVANALKYIGNLFVVAWEGIVAGAKAGLGLLVDFIKSLPGLIVAGLGGLVTLLVTAGRDLITGLFNGIKATWGLEISFIKSLPGLIVNALGSLVSVLVNAGNDLLTGLWNGITKGWSAISGWFSRLPGDIQSRFSTAASWLANAGNDIMTGLWNGIARGWGAISGWFSRLPGEIVNFFAAAASWLASAGNTIMTGLWNGLAQGWGNITGWFGRLPGEIMNYFSAAVGWLASAGNTIMTGLWNGIAQGWGAIAGWFSRLPGDIASNFISASTWLFNAGIDLIKGFLNGMIAALDRLPGIVKAFTGLDAVITGLHDAVNALDGAKVSIQANANTSQAQAAIDKLLATMNLLGNIPQGPPPSTYLPGPGAPNPLPIPPGFAMGGLTSGLGIVHANELVLPMRDLQRSRALLSQYGGPIVGGPGAAPGHMGQSTTHQYNINGNIVASDPMELERQLDTRARIAAMSGREQ